MKATNFVKKSESANTAEMLGTSSINKEMMSEVQGGVGSGYLNTFSGECNTTKKSCWVTIKSILDLVI